ncbi:MAG: hypothetical protein FJ117_20500 [Deltaproteobacteria bacterium]|nr:hypothetical protein [Deltaproteobacteria bacterium]
MAEIQKILRQTADESIREEGYPLLACPEKVGKRERGHPKNGREREGEMGSGVRCLGGPGTKSLRVICRSLKEED